MDAEVLTVETTAEHSLPAAASIAVATADESLAAAACTAVAIVDHALPAANLPAADAAARQMVDLAHFGRIHQVSDGTDVVKSYSIGATTVSDATDAESILSLDLSEEAARLDIADVPWFS